MGILKLRGFAMLWLVAAMSGCATDRAVSFVELELLEARVPVVTPDAEDRQHALQPSKWLSGQAGQGTSVQGEISGGCGCAEVSGTSFWSGVSDNPGVEPSTGNPATLRVQVQIPSPVPPQEP